MRIILDRLPMPPSENNAYPTNQKTGRRFPSGELKKYKQAMQAWRLANLRSANGARELLVSKHLSDQKPIRVDRYFAFKRDRLYHLSGGPTKLDASNRVKILDDALSEYILGIDDRFFWAGNAEKIESDEEECVIVVMQPYACHSLEMARTPLGKLGPQVLTW